jgi:sugar/nucleoside kinase (ribokinase family)
MPRLVVLAGMVTDLVASVRLPILPGGNQDACPMQFEAGAAANVMIAASRLGLSVAAIGALGDDPPGEFLRGVLHAEGVVTDAVQRVPGTNSPLTLALVDPDSKQHVFLGNVGDGPPVRFDGPIAAIITTLIQSADALYWQGYVLHERQIAPLVEPTLALARQANLPIYFDSGPTVRSIAPERVAWALRQSTILKMTGDEVPLAAEGRTGTAAHEYLLGLGAAALIVTHGADDCEVITHAGREAIPSFPAGVVDTIGAGDSFNAAFLYGRLAYPAWSLRACCMLGNAAGGVAVQKRGAGRNVPTRAEVLAMLAAAQSVGDADVEAVSAALRRG